MPQPAVASGTAVPQLAQTKLLARGSDGGVRCPTMGGHRRAGKGGGAWPGWLGVALVAAAVSSTLLQVSDAAKGELQGGRLSAARRRSAERLGKGAPGCTGLLALGFHLYSILSLLIFLLLLSSLSLPFLFLLFSYNRIISTIINIGMIIVIFVIVIMCYYHYYYDYYKLLLPLSSLQVLSSL